MLGQSVTPETEIWDRKADSTCTHLHALASARQAGLRRETPNRARAWALGAYNSDLYRRQILDHPGAWRGLIHQ